MDQEQILKTLTLISENSIYAFLDEIKMVFNFKRRTQGWNSGRVVLEEGDKKYKGYIQP